MKILASDMDGTLFFHRRVHLKDISAIRKFQKKGNKFGFCTGRYLSGAVDNNPIGLHPDFYIASSGAIILDRNLNVLYEKTIPYPLGKNIWDTYSKENWMMIHTGNREKTYLTTVSWKNKNNPVLVKDYDIVKEEKVHGFSVVVSTSEEAQKVAKEIEENYPEVWAFVNKNSIDIVPRGCSKGAGTKFIQSYYKDVLIGGIGDNYNDLPMLEEADIAFTFAKSPEEVKLKATHIVDSVAHAIKILMEE
ncbi:MAG: HAD-IIB family hydrolase [Bacillota bacterium]|nr:HAD-IIB family hydrolase [Bacillota bacterium]